jgi:uncharacterized protein (DUF1697 family)
MRAPDATRSLIGKMPVYAALLRGVMPMNCKMPALKAALEKAGFTDVKTVISSGNAVFKARAASESSLEKRCEDAMEKYMGRRFMTIVRSIADLEALLKRDAFAKFELPAMAKRNVTFFRGQPKPGTKLPIEMDGASILRTQGREAFLYYVPGQVSPTFMGLIEKTFGKDQTTRTWDTVGRIVKAGRAIA